MPESGLPLPSAASTAPPPHARDHAIARCAWDSCNYFSLTDTNGYTGMRCKGMPEPSLVNVRRSVNR